MGDRVSFRKKGAVVGVKLQLPNVRLVFSLRPSQRKKGSLNRVLKNPNADTASDLPLMGRPRGCFSLSRLHGGKFHLLMDGVKHQLQTIRNPNFIVD